ncbi:N-acetylmuramidase family protein [Psychrobacter sp. 72-O-c]|uniref:N-acetylmuramidase family protein n=1 Tax=Psychrobacter sp. 72-O-c TaxID=2774125 RepID=UPI001D0FDE69|nr:N-acetylmuramidase family protein [Psychrobacter sp. 72-O-c]
MSKNLSNADIATAAKDLGVSPSALKAVNEVEGRDNGFNADGTPTILFERHVFYERLGEHYYYTARRRAMKERPDLCWSRPTVAGGYGFYSEQTTRLADASKYHRDSALEACSWGVGQVMGYWWKELGYPSLQDFINDMYESEAKQLEAMCRYIEHFGLVDELQRRDWKGFARGYNGPNYYKSNYHGRLEAAEARHR